MTRRRITRLIVEPTQADAIAWLYSNAEVVESYAEGESLVLTAGMGEAAYEMLWSKFPSINERTK
jgi:hypothetical protein